MLRELCFEISLTVNGNLSIVLMYTKFHFCFHIIQQFGNINQDPYRTTITRNTSLSSNEVSHLNREQLDYMEMNINKMREVFDECISPPATTTIPTPAGRRKRLIEMMLRGY